MTSPSSELLVLMYHYVKGDRCPLLDGMYGPTQKEFETQLKKIKSKYEIISFEQFHDAQTSGTPLPEKSAMITFDDGTVDQYLHAAPVMDDLGVPGIFFLISSALEQKKIAAVQARHILTAKIGIETFKSEFINEHDNISEKKFNSFSSSIADLAAKSYRWDTPETGVFKYAVNFGIDPDKRNQIIFNLFEEHIGVIEEVIDQIYMDMSKAKDLSNINISVGGHSHDHESLSQLSEIDLKKDLSLCHQHLSRLSSNLPFSYPFGKEQHFSDQVISSLKELGFTYGFANIQGVNRLGGDDRSTLDLYRLLRIDPKDITSYA